MIIGGGVAGLSAAFSLMQDYQVTLCESNSKLGGRISSRTEKVTGDSIDNGQHLLIGAYTVFLDILKKSNSLDKLYIQNKFRIPYLENGKKFFLDGSKIPGDFGLLLGLLRMPFSIGEKLNAIKLILKIKIGVEKGLNQSAKSLLKKYEQEGRIFKVFWEPLILATINTSAEIASAELMVNVLKDGFFAGGDNKKLIFPKSGLSELLNGVEAILKEKIDLRLKSTVSSIIINDDGIIAKIKGKNQEFKKVIFAIPYHRISTILDSKKHFELSKKLSESSIISIYLWFDRCFFDELFASCIGTNIQWIFNKRKLGFCDGENKYLEYLSITISNSDNLLKKSSEEIVKTCIGELNSLIPESKEAELLHSKVIKEAKATFVASIENQNLRKNIEEIDNKVFFVGDWTYSRYPSTIEAAARSGKEIIKKIKGKNENI